MPLLKLHRNRFAPALLEAATEVTLAELRANPAAAAGADVLVIDNDEVLADIADDFAGFSVIVLAFPDFRDGRAYSQARLLRERYGFAGEIRARGDILRDQVWFMVRCGINALEFNGEAAAADAALGEFTYVYQAAADNAAPAARRRRSRAAAA